MQILTILTQLHQQNPSPTLKKWLQKNHDIQASQFLYQEANHPNYRRLKTLLKKKLLDLMLHLPTSDEELSCPELRHFRNAYLKALFKQKVSTEQAMLEEVDLIFA